MTTPNFRRGAPKAAPVRDGSWIAKYSGTCAYCGVRLDEGESRVKWSEDRTAVVCASHR